MRDHDRQVVALGDVERPPLGVWVVTVHLEVERRPLLQEVALLCRVGEFAVGEALVDELLQRLVGTGGLRLGVALAAVIFGIVALQQLVLAVKDAYCHLPLPLWM